MEQNSADLLKQLNDLTQDFSNLGENMSQATQELQHSNIPPSQELIEYQSTSSQKFEELHNRVLKLAESVTISPTQTHDEIVSLTDLKSLLQSVMEAENKKAEGKKVRDRALEVLDRVLAIAPRDQSDCPPLWECQKKASILRRTVSDTQCPDLHPDTEKLAKEEHPFVALLTLVERRGDGDYSLYAHLQKVVAESFPDFGQELSVAALMGDVFVPAESISEGYSISDVEGNQTISLIESHELETAPSPEQPPAEIDVPTSPEEIGVPKGEATPPATVEQTTSAAQLPTEITSQASPEEKVVPEDEAAPAIEETAEKSSVSSVESGDTPPPIQVAEDETPVETLAVATEVNQNKTPVDTLHLTEQPELVDEGTNEGNNSILQERYQLHKRLDTNDDTDQFSESWLGQDEDYSDYLIKLRRYQQEKPNEVLRRIWDNQLRTFYRLSSSPGAEESLLTLHDAGIARAQRAFVMVLKSDCNGYETLATALANRNDSRWQKCDWLQVNKNRHSNVRQQIWQGLRRLAAGIQLLHRQHVLHRNICAETIYFAPNQGPDSWRLGGFEWSVRLGDPSHSSPNRGWSTPPEFSDEEATGYTFDTDWYAFGMLAVRCFYKGLEEQGDSSFAELNKRVCNRVENYSSNLSEVEYRLIQELIAFHPESRESFSTVILRRIDEIINSLKTGISAHKSKQLLRLAFDPKNEKISDAARQAGFVPNLSKPDEDYNPSNSLHLEQLKNFLRESFESAKLYPVFGQKVYIIIGRITLLIDQYKSPGKQGTWDIAYAYSPGELRGSDGDSVRELADTRIDVLTLNEARSRSTKSNSQSWDSFLPHIDEKKLLREPLAKFREFLQCTNQLEFLMRDAEIFAYRICDRKTAEDGSEHIFIEERERKCPVPKFCQIKGGILEFLQRELDSGRKDCKLVLLTEEDSLRIDVYKNVAWEIVCINRERGYAELRRATSDRLDPVPESGYVRSFNHKAQVKVIERRKNAIDRLEDHSYLLQALAAPRPIDTKWVPPLNRLAQEKVDISKKAVIQDILRVRPIYALQGPPGTGKTTLVAHLLREIIDEDPVAQILVTAQAHPAVDVLREKVWNEAFGDVDSAKKPIAVRLGVGDDEEGTAQGTVEQVSRDLLQKTRDQLSELPSRFPLQEEWYEIVNRMLNVKSSASEPALADFQEIVKRGANITYCTTSAGDLEELAEGNESFDWSVVEEAGKAHGFELALPLQAGHRWMLLGDHKQLPPYRFNDYLNCLEHLDQAVKVLKNLPRRDRILLDTNWLQNWEDKDLEAQSNFIKYAKDRLTTFEYLFENLRYQAYGKEKMTITNSAGSASGRLSLQYRMHPTIGDLIFKTFYDEGNLYDEENIYNKPVTDDKGMPISTVRHPFVAPGNIKDKAVVWIDVPWHADNPNFEEQGDKQDKPRYTNPCEVHAVKEFLRQLRYEESPESSLKVAVLSPYSQQVALLRDDLRDIQLPSGMVFRENLRVKKGGANQPSRAHSVDSFQGNEADVVIISLVRNNRLLSEDGLPDGLGFLKEVERLNVLLSRAERLLVLVGSWKFFEWHLESVNINNRPDSLWQWKNILQMLTEAFADRRAIKIPYSEIVRDGGY